MKKLFNVLVVLDDVSDNPAVTRNNKMSNSLFVEVAIVEYQRLSVFKHHQPCHQLLG